MTALAAQSTTHPTPSCPRLAGLCTGIGDHDTHWSADNTLPSPHPHQQNIGTAQLFSIENAAYEESEPVLSIVLDFEGALGVHGADQLLAGLKAFTARLETQISELEAARRQWEATR